jgi:hypothetical protein
MIQRISAAAIVLGVLSAAPAFAQGSAQQTSRPVVTITNADLGKPAAARPQIPLTPEVWQSLVARQFVYVPVARPDYGGAHVAVSTWTSPTAEAIDRSNYSLSTPFFMSTYAGPYFYGRGSSWRGFAIGTSLASSPRVLEAFERTRRVQR